MTYYVIREDGAKIETLDKTGVEAVMADSSDNAKTVSSLEELNRRGDFKAWLGSSQEYEEADKEKGVLYVVGNEGFYDELDAKVTMLETEKETMTYELSTELEAWQDDVADELSTVETEQKLKMIPYMDSLASILDDKVIQFRNKNCEDPVYSSGWLFGPVASYQNRSWTYNSGSISDTWNGKEKTVRISISFKALPTKYHKLTRIRWNVSGEAFDPFSGSGTQELTMTDNWYERGQVVNIKAVTFTGPQSGSGNYRFTYSFTWTIEGQF